MCVCTSQNMYVADTFVLNRSVTKLITIIRSVRSGLFIRQSRSGIYFILRVSLHSDNRHSKIGGNN